MMAGPALYLITNPVRMYSADPIVLLTPGIVGVTNTWCKVLRTPNIVDVTNT